MPASSSDDSVMHAGPGVDPEGDAEHHRVVTHEIAFRRSLRTSRTRRAAAAVRRRRTLRSRRSLIGAAVGLVVLSAGAFAETGGISPSTSALAPAATGLTTEAIKAAQRALGVAADGVVGPLTRRTTRRFQRAHKIHADGVLGPATLGALGITARARSVSAPTSGARSTLQRIAQCESGGDATAVSAHGLYRGKYQFDRSTWRSVGGKGDPAAAPEAEQDRRAAMLLRRSGTTPWPNCG